MYWGFFFSSKLLLFRLAFWLLNHKISYIFSIIIFVILCLTSFCLLLYICVFLVTKLNFQIQIFHSVLTEKNTSFLHKQQLWSTKLRNIGLYNLIDLDMGYVILIMWPAGICNFHVQKQLGVIINHIKWCYITIYLLP